jgi:hypothetical protein
MKILFLLSLISFVLPVLSCDIDLCTRTSGNYQAYIKINRDKEGYTEGRSIYIKRNGKTIFSDRSFDYYYFGDPNENHKKYFIKDLNSNGIPDLVTTTYTGGSRCCYLLNIYELGPTLKRIFTIDTNYHGYEIRDLDHDGFFEILYQDPVLMCEGNNFLHCPESASGTIIFQWDGEKYKISNKLMKKAPIKAIKPNISDEGLFELEFIQYMADMSYTGNIELALKIAEESWPKSHSDFLKFKKQFISILNESQYWRKFQKELTVEEKEQAGSD